MEATVKDFTGHALRFNLLGPVRAWSGPTPIAVGRPQQQAVLVALLLRSGHSVCLDELVSSVWGEEPPSAALGVLRSHVSRLRSSLSVARDPNLLVSVPGGYALHVPAECVDAGVLESALGQASVARASGQRERAVEILTEALALSRGTPLAGVPGPFAASRRERLLELLLGAEQQRLELGLELGQHADLTAELRRLTDLHPLRERLRELLMLALYQGGRQADAISVFLDTQRQLDAELGVAPGPALQALYTRILRADPSLLPPAGTAVTATAGAGSEMRPSAETGPETSFPAPCLLPRPLTGFVARAEWEQLDGLRRFGGEAPRLAVLAGPAGSGKTTLLVRWAHSVADDFPDGRLYGDLQGFSPDGPADPAEILHAFLRALGVADDEIPDGIEAGAALYRSRIRDRRLLVLLDNATRSEDIALFLPGAGPSVTVVCSRHTLEEVIARQEATFLAVGAFTPDASHQLLRLRLGDPRALADPRAARRLAELCDHLPLALSIALAHLTTRPAWTIADLVAELEDEQARLAALGLSTRLAVEHELDMSRRLLSADASRLLPLLAVHQGSDCDPWIAAALSGRPLSRARAALRELAALHLLDETTPGRYRAHDLVRLYCTQLCAQELTDDERGQSTRRLLEYYIAVVFSAAKDAIPDGVRNSPRLPPAGGVPTLPTLARALEWFRREEQAVRRLTLSACDSGLHGEACRLAENASNLYYYTGGLLREWEQVCSSALLAAEAAQEGSRWPILRSDYAVVLSARGRCTEAIHHAEAAAEHARGGDDALHRYITHTRWANVLCDGGQPRKALPQMEIAIEEAERLGSVRRLAQALNNLADALLRLGEPAGALAPVERSVELLCDRTSDPFLAISIQTRAEALAGLGRIHDALAESHHALELGRTNGDARFESHCAEFIGTLLHRLGRGAEAQQQWQRALELGLEQGRPVEHLKTRLAQD
jgi:DNA-binding SARP family transcriptional activator/tetratricopeptide (TPR) repeat protein